MIQIKPEITEIIKCTCGGNLIFVCRNLVCDGCGIQKIVTIPINQGAIERYSYFPKSGAIINETGEKVKENWFSSKLKSVSSPFNDKIELEIEIKDSCTEVIILNTLDYVYGHSLLYLLNLQRLIEERKSLGIIVLVQPMMRWLIPEKGIAEIWTVKMGFDGFHYYYPDLSEKINSQLGRFSRVFLSKGHLIPTNKNILIEKFTRVSPFDFSSQPLIPRITLIWREDPGRMWIRNIYLSKGFAKLKIGWVLMPVHYLRNLTLLYLLRKKLGTSYLYTIAGLGKSGRFPVFVDDRRVTSFNDNSEKELCRLYSQSILTIGLHGSSMLLPSAHSGMAVSLLPSKRWGNYLEDILFNEEDLRLAFFHKRIMPLNMNIFDLRDMIFEMITGRDYFIKKFVHADEL
jgi:hypothetical protein